jgi:outer membrane lipoprotein
VKKIILPLFFVAFIFSSCSPISSSLRKGANRQLNYPTAQASPQQYVGQLVIWGGIIVQTTTVAPQGTEVEVMATPLTSSERPVYEGYSMGRFLIKTPQFLDPLIYSQGKRITVAGVITGQETRPLGPAQYMYIVLEPRQIHLWRNYYYYDYYGYNPYWDYYDGYWGPGFIGFGTVIDIDGHHHHGHFDHHGGHHH